MNRVLDILHNQPREKPRLADGEAFCGPPYYSNCLKPDPNEHKKGITNAYRTSAV